jgi:chemotaxis protein CheD
VFLEMEGIPIVGSDIGGSYARKLIFFPDTGKILMKKITGDLKKIVDTEARYKKKIELEM